MSSLVRGARRAGAIRAARPTRQGRRMRPHRGTMRPVASYGTRSCDAPVSVSVAVAPRPDGDAEHRRAQLHDRVTGSVGHRDVERLCKNKGLSHSGSRASAARGCRARPTGPPEPPRSLRCPAAELPQASLRSAGALARARREADPRAQPRGSAHAGRHSRRCLWPSTLAALAGRSRAVSAASSHLVADPSNAWPTRDRPTGAVRSSCWACSGRSLTAPSSSSRSDHGKSGLTVPSVFSRVSVYRGSRRRAHTRR